VIGSVLVEHVDPLAGEHRARIRNSVVQAAPVLANLRNLAIAELRAATDVLTGLPNNRALQGHGKGDEVLAAVGAALQATVSESDIVGRWGGEEFMILLADVDRAGAKGAAEKIREAVAKLKIVGVERAITASIGVAAMPDTARTSPP